MSIRAGAPDRLIRMLEEENDEADAAAAETVSPRPYGTGYEQNPIDKENW